MGRDGRVSRPDLSADERESLRLVCGGQCNISIPDEHASKLLDLGLAEVNCGEIRPTRSGRSALNLASGV